VFRIVRRTGGDLTGISKKAARDLADKLDTGNEIAVIISAKKLELRVISVIPAGLIGYMNLTGEDLLDPLYGNVTGVLIMTVCLCVYGAAVLLGRRLIRIEL
jgi:tight adherence protein B